jgi:dynein heavy chain
MVLDEDFAQEPEGALKGDANPGPTAELEFWENKSGNLNLIHQQLNDEKVRRVVKVLEVTKSTYFPAFNRLCKEVAQARMEVFAGIFWLYLAVLLLPQLAHLTLKVLA